jgi:sec-independent protein translocase protein TatB
MFDIGFSELAVIGVVALIVIGPERLPKVARTVGHLLGRAQRYAATVKSDISRELELEELKKTGQQFQQSLHETENKIAEELSNTERVMQSMTTSERMPLPDAGAQGDELTPPVVHESLQAELPLDAPVVHATPESTKSHA